MSTQAVLTQTLRELVAVDSTSSRPNAPMVELLERALRPLGFRCVRHTYRDSAGVEKSNLVATIGEEGVRPELALVGHTDCVPYDAAWKEALVLTEEDGKLFGRGACDTKAFIACALVALSRVKLDALTKPLAVIFTADEEVGCVGAKMLAQARAIQPRFAIVGEPTQLIPIRANKGYCLAEIELRGVEGHSAYPDSGASAIFRAGRLLERLEKLALGPLRAQGDTAFMPPFTTVNVGVISGGKAKNIIPGLCRLTLEWRPIPSQPVDLVARQVEGLLAELKREEPGFEGELTILRQDRGVETSRTSEVVRFLEAHSGRASDTVAFGTEAPQLTELGAEAAVFGPGNIQTAHRTGEFVPIPELIRCEEILESAIQHFCATRE